jgi:hypothetical protein
MNVQITCLQNYKLSLVTKRSLNLLPSISYDRKLTVRHHVACTRFRIKVFDII